MTNPNLPTTLSTDNFPTTYVTKDTPFNEVMSADLLTTAFIFLKLAEAWQQSNSIDDICKMSMMTFKALEKRRDFLGLPNAYQAQTQAKEYLVYPAD